MERRWHAVHDTSPEGLCGESPAEALQAQHIQFVRPPAQLIRTPAASFFRKPSRFFTRFHRCCGLMLSFHWARAAPAATFFWVERAGGGSMVGVTSTAERKDISQLSVAIQSDCQKSPENDRTPEPDSVISGS